MALVFWWCGIPAAHGAATPACRGPDAFSDRQLRGLRALMTTVDSTLIRFREGVHLPLVPDSAVQLVVDDSVCARALATWRAEDPTAYGALSALYVIRAGRGTYDTIDPAGPGGEWSQHIVLDSLFRRVDVYLY